MADASDNAPLAVTPLHALHRAAGARMVPFAGYDMPVQYPDGIIAEHVHTREKAGLFDVSHMGQAFLSGANVIARFETLVPGDIAALAQGRIRYTQLLNSDGGILDDMMVTRLADDRLFLVVNAACKAQDFAHIARALPDLKLEILDTRALLALQGPMAAAVLSKLLPGVELMPFMSAKNFVLDGAELYISRSGYTGEDGYEISVPGVQAESFTQKLLSDDRVKLIGLGARDSLRLEAGLCLYGHDIDTTTTPVEGDLLWSISKRRRSEGGFPGADKVQKQIADGIARKRVGLALEGKAPAREGAEIADSNGTIIGRLTSGAFAPSLQRPIAMGYVASEFAKPDTQVSIIVRGKPLAARIVAFPFVPTRYYRGP
jgi:aminomethyltransferase